MKKFYIDFGAFDDNRNFNWSEIRKEMTGYYESTDDLGDIPFDTKEDAENILEKIKDHVDTSIVKIVES